MALALWKTTEPLHIFSSEAQACDTDGRAKFRVSCAAGVSFGFRVWFFSPCQ